LVFPLLVVLAGLPKHGERDSLYFPFALNLDTPLAGIFIGPTSSQIWRDMR